ncbi:MAG: hypothetical protein JWO06_3295 [Bacteroidota bacterium]|nr:hypothetical protein [Bacteroidota bacterium]
MVNVDDIQQEVFDSFEIDGQLLPAANDHDEKFKAFRGLLIRRIEELAEKDMDKLIWLLYRVDVSERKLQEVLKKTPPDEFSSVIADLIIERQLEKVESRKKFGNKEGDWSFDI